MKISFTLAIRFGVYVIVIASIFLEVVYKIIVVSSDAAAAIATNSNNSDTAF